MDSTLINRELDSLSTTPGVRACALVEGKSGLVLGSAGLPTDDRLWEAAVDYWRLHQRMAQNFEALGPLKVAVMHHQFAKLVLMPCSGQAADLLVACLGEHHKVDWNQWQVSVWKMAEELALQ